MPNGSAPVLLKVSHCLQTIDLRNQNQKMPHSTDYSNAIPFDLDTVGITEYKYRIVKP